MTRGRTRTRRRAEMIIIIIKIIKSIFDNNGGIAWHATSTRNVIGVAAVIGEVKAYGDATAALVRCA